MLIYSNHLEVIIKQKINKNILVFNFETHILGIFYFTNAYFGYSSAYLVTF